jgi:hypothetical protein
VNVINFPGELHVHMVMNKFLLINRPCESEKVFVDWLRKQTASAVTSASKVEANNEDRTT